MCSLNISYVSLITTLHDLANVQYLRRLMIDNANIIKPSYHKHATSPAYLSSSAVVSKGMFLTMMTFLLRSLTYGHVSEHSMWE